MSIQSIAWVLEHSRAEGSDRLVLAAIANHADAFGLNAWPCADQIAKEARVSRATVFRSINRLESLGELSVSRGGNGTGRRNSYRLILGSQGETLEPAPRVSTCDLKGLNGADLGSHSCDTEPSLTTTVLEPSFACAPARENAPDAEPQRQSFVSKDKVQKFTAAHPIDRKGMCR